MLGSVGVTTPHRSPAAAENYRAVRFSEMVEVVHIAGNQDMINVSSASTSTTTSWMAVERLVQLQAVVVMS